MCDCDCLDVSQCGRLALAPGARAPERDWALTSGRLATVGDTTIVRPGRVDTSDEGCDTWRAGGLVDSVHAARDPGHSSHSTCGTRRCEPPGARCGMPRHHRLPSIKLVASR